MLTNAYCTLNQVKASLRIPVADTVDDTLLELAINAASRDIDQATERQFFSTTATRIYTPQDSLITKIDDLISLTSLKVSTGADGTFDLTFQATDLQLEPLNGLVGGISVPFDQIRAVGDFTYPISGGEATVQVTGVFGFTSVPVAIEQATVLLASRIFKRNDSPGGVMGFGDIGVIRVSRIDPDIDRLIMPYKKMRFA